MIQPKVTEKIKTHTLYLVTFLRKSSRLRDNVGKIRWSQEGRRWQNGGALHAGLVRLHARKHTQAPVHRHTHTQNYVLLIGFADAPQCYVGLLHYLFYFTTFSLWVVPILCYPPFDLWQPGFCCLLHYLDYEINPSVVYPVVQKVQTTPSSVRFHTHHCINIRDLHPQFRFLFSRIP